MLENKNFIDLNKVDKKTLRKIIELGKKLKSSRSEKDSNLLRNKTLAMIFEKPSTRTRVSFEVGMRQLGGDVVTLLNENIQSGRGETYADTARVLSRYVDALMVRTDDSNKLDELVSYSTVPVINGLTNSTHPCQIMADIMTFEEHRGSIKDKIIAWTGDGNNVANTLIQGAVQFDFILRLACPPELGPDKAILEWGNKHGGRIKLTTDPHQAVEDADCIITDTWVSMHNTEGERIKALTPYTVNKKLMSYASKDAIFMHCLPAHRGQEVEEDVIDGPQSVVWDEAENRLHVQKAILSWILQD
ncbi:MAG: ornithine carbamoyltransferase [Alphaproteobacteria bacterium TMED87]|nr:ornithine carbamoyltransferase [Rhodospirillaceae bacterium]OUV07892.1 MAG: ornithine carbamoyltransferase [Alphaproteobacteria bacterium TMED87]